MSGNQLAELFGSITKVKLLRLFLFNPNNFFDVTDAAIRIKSLERDVEEELTKLCTIGFLKRKRAYKEVAVRRRGKRVTVRRLVKEFTLKPRFPYIRQLEQLLLPSESLERLLAARVRKFMRLKLLVATGLFMGEQDGRVDLLLVGDHIQPRRLDRALRSLETDIGRELRYVALSSVDFTYRAGVNDRLVRDILDYPHKIIVDRLGVS